MPPNSADADIGDALRDQFAVGAMAAAGHAVGDHRRQQRFDGAEQGEGDGVGQHRRDASRARVRAGAARAGRLGMPPKRVPIVSTGRPKRDVSDAATVTAISMPGQRGRQLLERPTMSGDRRCATPSAAGSSVGSAAHSTGSFSSNGPGSGAASRQPEQVLDLAGER